MAVLALAAGGAALGWAAVGTTMGAQVGWVLGSLIGQSAFAPKAQGPRLEDLKATALTYGAVIPFVEGHPRVPGCVAWASEKREIANSSGGKGGGGSVTNYTYECDVLYILAENRCAGIRRIWLNGELIWSVAAESEDETIDASDATEHWQGMVFYDGHPDQLPDPTYSAAVGLENAPAYRGCTTLVLKGVQMGSSGILPAFTFEISGPVSDYSGNTTLFLEDFAENEFLFDPPCGSWVAGPEIKVCTINRGNVTTHLRKNGVTTKSYDAIPHQAMRNEPGSGNGNVAATVFGLPIMSAGFAVVGSGNSRVFELPDPTAFLGTDLLRFSVYDNRIAVGTKEEIGAGADSPEGSLGNQGLIWIYNLDGTLERSIAFGDRVDGLALLPNALYVHVVNADIVTYVDGVLSDPISLPSGSAHRIFSGIDGKLYCANNLAHIYQWNVIDLEWVQVAAMELMGADLSTANCIHAVSSYGDVYALEMYGINKFGSRLMWAPSIDPTNYFSSLEGAMFSTNSVFTGWYGTQQYVSGGGLRPRRGFEVELVSIGSYVPPSVPLVAYVNWDVQYYFFPGELTPATDYGWRSDPSPDQSYYQSRRPPEAFQEYYHNVYKHRVRPGAVLTEPTLQEVVERQCLRAGLSLEDIDASDLATRNVRCMAITQLTSPRQVIEILAGAYFFNASEAEQIVFRFRGKDPVMTIPFAELGVGETEPLESTRANDLELPAQFNVRYMNVEDDYQDGSELSDRLISTGQSIAAVDLPVGFTAQEAKRIADVLVVDQVASMTRIGPVGLTRAYSKLQAGDVVVLEDEDGTPYRVRLIRCTFESGCYKFDAVTDDASVLESLAETSEEYPENLTVVPAADTVLEVLDIPLLRDVDDGMGHYVAAEGTSDKWPGYTLFRSRDNVSFENILEAQDQAVIGAVAEAVSPWFGGNVFDWKTRITVDIGVRGQLYSSNRRAVLDTGANACLIGHEVIQYIHADLQSPGVYVLSGLLRGRRGTEWAVNLHIPGERFVTLAMSGLRRVTTDLTELHALRYFKGVTYGRRLATADSIEFTNTAVSQKPWAPVHLRGSRDSSGNLTISWKRRTRLSTSFAAATVPLGEATEAYSIDIYDGSPLDVVRTLTSNSESVVYSAAQQTTDFGGAQSAVLAVVYQLSALVGRGYPLEGTV